MSSESTIVVGGVEATLIRKDIKHLHLAVYPPDGWVRIAAPESMPEEAIKRALIRRLPWVRRQQREITASPRQSPREMVAGESHYLLGRRYRLRVEETNGATTVRRRGHGLVLEARPDASLKARLNALDAFYRTTLRDHVDELLALWTTEMGVGPVDYRLLRMRTRWGTADAANRRITLNPELAKQPIACVEYVVVHELAHLIEHTHGEKFIALMDQYLPDWRDRRDKLRAAVVAHENWKY